MRSNTVYTIDVSRVLPKATFSCPHLFWGEDLPGASIRKILDQLPRELVSKAEKALPGRIADAGELDQYAEWFPGKIFYFADEYWLKARFLQRQNGYIQLNCPSGMSGINEILATYRFERADFGDPLKVLLFLRLVKLYDNGLPSDFGQTRALMNILRNDYRLNTWLGGTEKDEGVFKRLYRDPQILLEGNEWTIIYNVFKFNGGVDQWRLSGAHDPVMHTNQIQSIDIRPLKPKGTFCHPLK